MNTLELLQKQTEDAFDWTHRLYHSIPHSEWETIPDQFHTNLSWQIGHLVISTHYHIVFSLRGLLDEIRNEIPLREYGQRHGWGSDPKEIIGLTNPEILTAHLRLIQETGMQILKAMTLDELQEDIVPGRDPHPVARTKGEVISWNVQHTMWHCGQIAMIRSHLDKNYDFRNI